MSIAESTLAPDAVQPHGCACPDATCSDRHGHLWTRADVAHVARNSPRTVGKHAREDDRCPLYKVGLGRGANGARYTWPEVEAYLAWLANGRTGQLAPVAVRVAPPAPAPRVLTGEQAHPGLALDPRQRQGGLTIYVRGRLLPELLDLLRARHPQLDLGRTLNLTKAFGVRDRDQAHAWLAERWRELHRRRRGDQSDLTLAEALDAYQRDLEGERERPFAPATINARLVPARRVVEQLGAERVASTLHPSELDELAAALVSAVDAPSSKAKARGGARTFLGWVAERGALPLVDEADLRRAFSPKAGGLVARTRARWLTRPELRALVEAADELSEDLAGLVRLLLFTGPRLHSALELRWAPEGPESGWVDLDAGLIHYWSRKTRSGHVWRLAWSPSVEAWLRARARPAGLVFDGLTPDAVAYALRETRRAGGQTTHPDGPLRRAVPGLRWKDLRSTCATYLHNASGIPGSTLEKAQALGHRVSTAERDYVNPGCVVDRAASTLEQAMALPATTTP